MSHPTNLTASELREWHRHIRAAIRAGVPWKQAFHTADRFIEIARERTAKPEQEPKPKPYDPGPLPDWAPPLPEGLVYLGPGNETLMELGPFEGWAAHSTEPNWEYNTIWIGNGSSTYYAAHADSEVARALGLGGGD